MADEQLKDNDAVYHTSLSSDEASRVTLSLPENNTRIEIGDMHVFTAKKFNRVNKFFMNLLLGWKVYDIE